MVFIFSSMITPIKIKKNDGFYQEDTNQEDNLVPYLLIYCFFFYGFLISAALLSCSILLLFYCLVINLANLFCCYHCSSNTWTVVFGKYETSLFGKYSLWLTES